VDQNAENAAGAAEGLTCGGHGLTRNPEKIFQEIIIAIIKLSM
jgi:hypothetical protein